MVLMQEKPSTSKQPHELAGDRLIEIAQKKHLPEGPAAPAKPTATEEAKAPRTTVFQKLSKLKPLLPILSGGLRLVDHGAVQVVAQLLSFVDGSNATQSAAQEELHHGLSEIQTSHSELRLLVQDQTVEMRRIEEQITRLRETAERNATEQVELVEDVKALGNLVRTIGAAVSILLVILILLTGFLLVHRQ